jgi:nucleoside-diphosphate-sugar epimerase
MKPVLITGGAGSVGRQLATMLLNDGIPVRIFDLPFMDFDGLEDKNNVEIFKGDITDAESVTKAVTGVKGVLHLAAILPPNSEKNKDFTFKVNVEGTNNILKSINAVAKDATIVFTSSISTYGDTSKENNPVSVDHEQKAIDVYAASKIAGEQLVISSGVKYVILRIASIAVPAFIEPADPWPFTSTQKVEMVHRDDVADAIRNSVDTEEAVGKIFNIAGGSTWRHAGKKYVEDFFTFMGAPVDMANYRESPGWNHWYDTEKSQEILKYQNRSYEHYSNQMKEIIEDMMA